MSEIVVVSGKNGLLAAIAETMIADGYQKEVRSFGVDAEPCAPLVSGLAAMALREYGFQFPEEKIQRRLQLGFAAAAERLIVISPYDESNRRNYIDAPACITSMNPNTEIWHVPKQRETLDSYVETVEAMMREMDEQFGEYANAKMTTETPKSSALELAQTDLTEVA